MYVPVERFIGVLDDYTILFLRPCGKCKVLITYPEQGHHCQGVVDVDETRRMEAEHYIHLMQKVKKLYTLPPFDAPRK
jgi:hypothetical protein